MRDEPVVAATGQQLGERGRESGRRLGSRSFGGGAASGVALPTFGRRLDDGRLDDSAFGTGGASTMAAFALTTMAFAAVGALVGGFFVTLVGALIGASVMVFATFSSSSRRPPGPGFALPW